MTLEVSPDMLRRQITMGGSWTFSTNKGVALDRIITDRWKLKDAAEAYAKFDMQQMGKGMLLPG